MAVQGNPGPARESDVSSRRTGNAGDAHLFRGRVAGKEPDRRLGRSRRITRSSLFQQTYSQGRRWIGPCMVLWLREGEGASLRLGVVAGKKVGGAVQRARAKRLLREAYRLNRYRFAGPVDVVLIARRAILEARWDDLVRELMALAQKAGLMPAGGD